MSSPELPWWRKLGPGLITGAADDDPSGIATYSQGGAQFGLNIAWTVLFTYPLMVAIQLASARIGRVTGKGLTACGSRPPKAVVGFQTRTRRPGILPRVTLAFRQAPQRSLLTSYTRVPPLDGSAPTVDLAVGDNKANRSPILKLFLSGEELRVAAGDGLLKSPHDKRDLQGIMLG